MTMQPRWNENEAAILLEAVLNVEKGIEKRKEAIVRVSDVLRRMAQAQGIDIDEKYRNVNGITFQFQSMECAVFGRKNATNKQGTKLFENVVKTRMQEPKEYEKLLAQAKKIVDDNKSRDKMNYRDAFREWLSSQGKKENIVEYIVNEFDGVSAYAKEKKISAVDMWDISSIKQYLKFTHALQEYKFFRVLQKEKYKFFQNYAKLYMSFLKDGLSAIIMENTEYMDVNNEYAVSDIDKKLYVEYPRETREIYKILKEDKKHAYLTISQIASLAECTEDIAEIVLSTATWSEKLSDGFVLGINIRYKVNRQISLSVNRAYGNDTREEVILKKDFRRGFRPHSIMDRKRFLNLYEEKYGSTLSDDEVTERVESVSFEFDQRLFLPKAIIDKNVADEMCKYVESYFAKREILFYDVLYEVYKDQFNSLVYNPDMLAAFIKFTFSGTRLFFCEKYFSYNPNAKPDIAAEVSDYLIKMDRPCSYGEIYSALPHLTQDSIYSVLHYNNPEILGNSKTEYFHVEVAHVNKKQKSVLETYCGRLLEGSRYITCNELIDKLPQIDMDLYEQCEGKFTRLGIRRILTYYLRAKFDVMTGVITRKGEQMTIKDVFADYARTHLTFSADDVMELADYTGTVPYWDAIHDNAIRIDGSHFVSDSMVDFEVDKIDDAIAFYCEEYCTLAEIADYMRFPSCGYPWNIYLLQEYAYRFSKLFKLAFLGFAKGSASGVIVRKQQKYHDFESLVIDALSKTDITTKKDAMDYLCNRGFITDRRYKKVEELLKKAIVLRQKNNRK